MPNTVQKTSKQTNQNTWKHSRYVGMKAQESQGHKDMNTHGGWRSLDIQVQDQLKRDPSKIDIKMKEESTPMDMKAAHGGQELPVEAPKVQSCSTFLNSSGEILRFQCMRISP